MRRVLIIGAKDSTDIILVSHIIGNFETNHSDQKHGRYHHVAYVYENGRSVAVWHTPKQITVHFGDGKNDA